MKLVFVIINNDDENKLLDSLSDNDFRVTRVSSSGGFLKTGNVTFLSAMEDSRVNLYITLIKRNCRSRKQILDVSALHKTMDDISMSYKSSQGAMYSHDTVVSKMDEGIDPYNVEVNVGGAIIFVLNVEKFYRL